MLCSVLNQYELLMDREALQSQEPVSRRKFSSIIRIANEVSQLAVDHCFTPRLQENTRPSNDKAAVVMIKNEVYLATAVGNIRIGFVDLLTRTKTIPLLLKAKESGEYPRTWRPGNNNCPLFSPLVFSRADSKISTFFTLKCRRLQQLYRYFEGKMFSMPTAAAGLT